MWGSSQPFRVAACCQCLCPCFLGILLFIRSILHSAFWAASRFVLFCFWFLFCYCVRFHLHIHIQFRIRMRFWFRCWSLFCSFVSSIGRVRAWLPSLSSVECLCLCFDFGLDSILYPIIYCPTCGKNKKKKKEGKSRNKEERKIVRSRRNRKGKGYVVCPERYAGLPIAGPRKANANTFASHPITSSICYYFGSLWFWSLLWPGDAVVVTTLLCPLFMGCSLASNLLRPFNSECRIPIPVRAQQWPQMKNPLRLIVSPVTWN